MYWLRYPDLYYQYDFINKTKSPNFSWNGINAPVVTNSLRTIRNNLQNIVTASQLMKLTPVWNVRTYRSFATRLSQLKIWHFWVIGIVRNVCRCTFNRHSVITQSAKLAAGEQLCHCCTYRKLQHFKTFKIFSWKVTYFEFWHCCRIWAIYQNNADKFFWHFEDSIFVEYKTVFVSENIKFKVNEKINLCNLRASFPAL